MKAKIEIKLEDILSYKFEYETGNEEIYNTIITSLIYDEEGNIIASDDRIEEYTSKYFVTPNETKIIYEYTDEKIITMYMGTINRMLSNIVKCNADTRKYGESLNQCGLDWEDVMYNWQLWDQYKPLYDLLKNKGYDLELQVA